MNGVKVKIVQRRLGLPSTYWETVDSTTTTKGQALPAQQRLPADGVVDSRTWTALNTGRNLRLDRYQARVTVPLSADKPQRTGGDDWTRQDVSRPRIRMGRGRNTADGTDCSGLVPQWLYAAGMDPQPISVDKHVRPLYRTSHSNRRLTYQTVMLPIVRPFP